MSIGARVEPKQVEKRVMFKKEEERGIARKEEEKRGEKKEKEKVKEEEEDGGKIEDHFMEVRMKDPRKANLFRKSVSENLAGKYNFEKQKTSGFGFFKKKLELKKKG